MALEEKDNNQKQAKRKKRRWGDAAPTAPPVTVAPVTAPPVKDDARAKVLAMQESIKARLAAAKAAAAVNLKRPAATVTAGAPPTAKRAKHYNVDLNATAPTRAKLGDLSTTKNSTPAVPAATKAVVKARPKPVRPSNPYLAHTVQDEQGEDNDPNGGAPDASVEDDRLFRSAKPRPRNKTYHFAEPGKWQQIADKQREKATAVAAAGFLSGRKAGHSIHAAGLSAYRGSGGGGVADDILDTELKPRADAHPDTRPPVALEWWDVELLPSKLKKQVVAAESKAVLAQSKAAVMAVDDKEEETTVGETEEEEKDNLAERCWQHASLSYSKTATLVQHIVPVKPPNAVERVVESKLHLTKKELKRLRKKRREEKQRDLQDLQAAGLVPAPEPRLTLQNFIQVMGDQAFVDPSQMEVKVQEQMRARQRAHQERNAANKLTTDQLALKRARRRQEDTSQQVSVAIFYVKDVSHPYHRTKLDLNAQQNKISGGVLECPGMACVICEGGPKAIQRFSRLLLVRMKWTGLDEDEEDDDEEEEEEEETNDDDAGDTEKAVKHKFNPDNKCELVWQGMSVKRLFNSFVFQSCETSGQARKVLKAKGVAHYWDQVVQHVSGQGNTFHLRLVDDDGEESDNPYQQQADRADDDVIMQDEN